MKKTALITGIAGQDGSYLAEFLLSKGYEVHGVEIKTGDEKIFWRIRHILDKLIIHAGDVSDYETVKKLVSEIKSDEIYHLASLHEVKNTPENFQSILRVNVSSTYYFLHSIKSESPHTKFFFAGSSRVFVGGSESHQNESTPMRPVSLYGITKTASINMVRMFREKEGLFACSGFLFNHESPRRDPEFLTRKISKAVAEIKNGRAEEIKLGDLSAKRDWGFAGDFVEAMWLMLQAKEPEDYILGTGETHSVKDFLDTAFGAAGLDWKDYVKIDGGLVRPEELELRADIRKAKEKLGWIPKTSFKELVAMMVEADLGQRGK